MSYAGLGQLTLAPLTHVKPSAVVAGGVAGTITSYPPVERDEIVRALRAAAIVRGGSTLSGVPSIRAKATADVRALQATAAWIAALRPNRSGMIDSPVLYNLLNGMLTSTPDLRPRVDAQLTFSGPAHPPGPTLAQRMAAMKFDPMAAQRATTTEAVRVAGTPVRVGTTVTGTPVASRSPLSIEAAQKQAALLAALKQAEADTLAAAEKQRQQATAASAAELAAKQEAQRAIEQAVAIVEQATDQGVTLPSATAPLPDSYVAPAQEAAIQEPAVDSNGQVVDIHIPIPTVTMPGASFLGVPWKLWGMGAAVAAVGYVAFGRKKKMEANRRRRRRSR